MVKVLLVEDERSLAEVTADTLALYDFEVFHGRDAAEGLTLFRKERPDIVIADIMMPGMDGYAFVKKIREMDKAAPVIFVTAKSQLSDVLLGFDVGANDYIKKPFRYEELIARMRALLHFKSQALAEPVPTAFTIGQYVFNAETQELRSNSSYYQLSFKEAEILKRLCAARNKVVDSNQLLMEVWGDDSFFNSRSLHVFITRLRKYLADDPAIQILNLRAVGFKLIVR